MLGIKADTIPSDVTTVDRLASYLGLEELPTATILETAKYEKVILVIDQLDAEHKITVTCRSSNKANYLRSAGDTS